MSRLTVLYQYLKTKTPLLPIFNKIWEYLKLHKGLFVKLVVFIFLSSLFWSYFGHNLSPPKILYSFPEIGGQEIPLDTQIEIVFDRNVFTQSLTQNLKIEPQIDGDYVWEGQNRLLINPKSNLQRSSNYSISFPNLIFSKFLIPGKIKPLTFKTLGDPRVVLSSPQFELPSDYSPITVVFDRPMLGLTNATNSANRPPAFSVEPKIIGTGRWLGTTSYQFTPEVAYKKATTYQVKFTEGLKSIDGGVLPQDFDWSFSGVRPKVESTTPVRDYEYANPAASISALFSQNIILDSVKSRFKLTDDKNQEITGRIVLSGRRFGFYPQKPLSRNQTYKVVLQAGIQSSEGPNGLETDYSWQFKTAPPPQVLSSIPTDGTIEKDFSNYSTEITIDFNTPMSQTSLQNITIVPKPEGNFRPYLSWPQDKKVNIYPSLLPETTYTVNVPISVRDKYGIPLVKSYSFKFTTGKKHPFISIFPSQTNFAAFNQTVTPRVVATIFGSKQVDYSLYQLSRDEFLNLYKDQYRWEGKKYSNQAIVHQWSEKIDTTPNNSYRMITKVTDRNGNVLPSGFYYLDMRLPSGQSDSIVMIVSKSVLTLKKSPNQTLIWAVDQSSGEVVGDMDLEITDAFGISFGKGQTNQDGVWIFDTEKLPERETFVFGQKDNEQVLIVNNWGDGIDRYSFGLPYYSAGYRYSNTGIEPHQLFIQPDRPIYRPGQTVYFQGLIRKDRDGDFSQVNPDSEVKVVINDPNNRNIYNQNLKVNSFGSYSGQIVLSRDSSLGQFELIAEFAGNRFSRPFQVEEYRKPEVSLSVNLSKNNFVHQERLDATIQASYYFGAPVANASVTWSLLTQDTHFNWTKNWRYEFGNPDKYWSMPWWDYDGGYYYSGSQIMSGSGTTDENGQLKINIPLNIAKYSAPQKMVIEAVVNDISNQSVAASNTFSVYQGTIFAGLSPERYGGRQNEPQAVSIVTVNTDGKEVLNQKVTVSFYKRAWQSVRVQDPDTKEYYYKSTKTDTLKATSQVTTDNSGYAKAEFTPDSGGTYIVKAAVTDTSGRTNTTGTYLWISGSEYSSPRENHDRINLIPGKPQYEIGDTASIFIDTPYATESAKTLVTMERGKVLDYKVIDTNENQNNFSFDIKSNYSPNLYLSALLIRPGNTVGKPAEFKMGLTQISVQNKEKHLNIQITSDKTRYQPGNPAKFKLKVTNDKGVPVKAELAFGLVDQAVWDLSTINLADIHTVFYQPRALNVQTSNLLTISMDRINANTNLGAKGGSGGGPGDENSFDTSRKDFPDTAYWNPSIVTDDQGVAELDIKLPDSLTTWRLLATANTQSSAFGSNFSKIIVTRDVLVRPFLPRFLSVGDRSLLGSIITNTTDSPQTVTARIDSEGLKISETDSQTKSIPAGGSSKFTWNTEVLATSSARVLLSLNTSQNYKDSASFSLPVNTYYTPEVVSTAGLADPISVEEFKMPEDVISDLGELTINLSNSLGGFQPEIINYLLDYSYYCAEQTSSKLLPFVYYHNVLGQKPELADHINSLVQRLTNLQHSDGGWGWWQQGDSQPYLSAIAYQALFYQSQNSGKSTNKVDVKVLDRAAQYLIRQLSQSSASIDDNTRAFILYVLRNSNQKISGFAASLYSHPEKLSTAAKSQLALSSKNLPGFTNRYRKLFSEIESLVRKSSTTTHWEDRNQGYYFGSNITTTAQVLELLLSENPKHPYVSQTMRYLESAKINGRYNTTRENAAVILALSSLNNTQIKSVKPVQYRLTLNTLPFQEGSLNEPQIFKIPLGNLKPGQENKVEIAKSGTSPLFYNFNLRYFLPFAEYPALDQGIVIVREFVDSKGKILPAKTVRENSEVRIRLTIVTPETRRHVVVEDFLPAGLEAVNTNLNNVVKDSQPYSWEDYWQNMSRFGHTEFRDDRIVLFAEYLPSGIYQYTYRARATTPGVYHYPAATAYQMYVPDISGHTASGFLTVTPR